MKTPGHLVDEALTSAHKATAKMNAMVTKRELKRLQIEFAIADLEKSVDLLKEALRGSGPTI